MRKSVNLIFVLGMISYANAMNGHNHTGFDGEGIKFEQGISWKNIVLKAKAQGKYIFVDCYTTWCGPCKQMEREIYPVKKVADFFNDKFICVKMQMDTAKNDNETIKGTYQDARFFVDSYQINAYPSFLFFTPDGRILNKSGGLQRADDFIRLAADAISPEKNYYELLKNYESGKRNLREMSCLALTALNLLRDTAVSYEISREYLLDLKKDSLLTKANIEFMLQFTKDVKDVGFKIFYDYADSINVIMQSENYAQQFVQYIISKCIVAPEIQKHEMEEDLSAAEWQDIASLIRTKYNDYYSDRVITGYKADWYGRHRNWQQYTKYFIQFVVKYGPKSGFMADFYRNNAAWSIFEHSNNKDELNLALSWSNRVVMMDPSANYMDTYANILYKLDRRSEAIAWEETAAKLDPSDKSIEAMLTKMKNGEPTWIIQK